MKFHPERLASERARLGLSIDQLAALTGIDPDLQKEAELGTKRLPVGYEEVVQRLGINVPYIYGNAEEPAAQPELLHADEEFMDAVALLRRSKQAVEAFVGPGAATRAPELVAALMNATIANKFSPGPGTYEDLGDRIAQGFIDAARELAVAVDGLAPKS